MPLSEKTEALDASVQTKSPAVKVADAFEARMEVPATAQTGNDPSLASKTPMRDEVAATVAQLPTVFVAVTHAA